VLSHTLGKEEFAEDNIKAAHIVPILKITTALVGLQFYHFVRQDLRVADFNVRTVSQKKTRTADFLLGVWMNMSLSKGIPARSLSENRILRRLTEDAQMQGIRNPEE
jgi:hypothetical protein